MNLDKHSAKNTYIILLEILIAFSVFGIFFAIFMNYFFVKYETELLSNFINNSVSIYKSYIAKDSSNLSSFLYNNSELEQIRKDSILEEHLVEEYNKPLDNKLIKIIGVMILILIVICLAPFVFSNKLSGNDINLKYLAISFVLHLIFIIIFELLFVFYVLPYISPIKLHATIESNPNYQSL